MGTVILVEERRKIQFSLSSGVGSRAFLVKFSEDDLDLDYIPKLNDLKFAVDPNYIPSGMDPQLRVPRKDEVLHDTLFPNFVVDDVTAEQVDSQNNLWEVVAEYRHKNDLSNLLESNIDPWDEPWVFDWNKQNIKEILYTDKAAVPKVITHSNGIAPDGGVEVDGSLQLITITRKTRIADFDPNVAESFTNSYNDAALVIQTYPKGSELIKVLGWTGITGTKDVNQGGTVTTKEFWNETVILLVGKESWRGKLFDAAAQGINQGDNQLALKNIGKGEVDYGINRLRGDGFFLMQKDGVTPTGPPTAGAGFTLHPSTTNAAVFTEWDFQKRLDLTPLNLDGQP